MRLHAVIVSMISVAVFVATALPSGASPFAGDHSCEPMSAVSQTRPTLIDLDEDPGRPALVRDASTAKGKVEVVFLGTAGFLLRWQEASVLIDAFIDSSRPADWFSPPPEEARAAMVAGEAPFETVKLCLVSHPHGDHFEPGFARRFLESRKGAHIVLAPDAKKLFKAKIAKNDPVLRRVYSVRFAPGQIGKLMHEGIVVEYFPLAHADERFRNVQNLGHLVTVSGWTILHLGDTGMEAKELACYNLRQRRVDIAFVPYFFFLEPEHREVIEREICAEHLIAYHIPPGKTREVAQRLAKDGPEAIVFEKPMDSRCFGGAKEEESDNK